MDGVSLFGKKSLKRKVGAVDGGTGAVLEKYKTEKRNDDAAEGGPEKIPRIEKEVGTGARAFADEDEPSTSASTFETLGVSEWLIKVLR